MTHTPVLLKEVIDCLKPVSGGVYLDCTLGDGGHAQAVLEASQPNGRVIGLDADSHQVAIAKKRLARFGDRATCVCAPFSTLHAVAIHEAQPSFDGILFDLGFSSRQLEDSRYGLTYDDTAPLDMRLKDGLTLTAAEWLNRANQVEIADALYYYGDRHSAKALARAIVDYRRKHQFRVALNLKTALAITSPSQLAPIWQAIRIVINDEYGELTAAIPQAIDRLSQGGRLVVITFHSGEDRLVKRLLKSEQLTKQTLLMPTYVEIKRNRRSRSAKLRYTEKLKEVL